MKPKPLEIRSDGKPRAAAAALVPQPWAARAGWPWGWPPDAVKEFVEGVRAARVRPLENPRLSPPWLATLPELDALQAEERELWIFGALLELDAKPLQAAIGAAPESDADADDVATIRWQLRQREEAEQWLAEHAEEGERTTRRADRALIFDRLLGDIADRRAAVIKAGADGCPPRPAANSPIGERASRRRPHAARRARPKRVRRVGASRALPRRNPCEEGRRDPVRASTCGPSRVKRPAEGGQVGRAPRDRSGPWVRDAWDTPCSVARHVAPLRATNNCRPNDGRPK